MTLGTSTESFKTFGSKSSLLHAEKDDRVLSKKVHRTALCRPAQHSAVHQRLIEIRFFMDINKDCWVRAEIHITPVSNRRD
jgi:hypothetical protein